MKDVAAQKRDRALFQAREIMLDVARARGTITYGELADQIEVMKLPPNGAALEGILTQISRKEDSSGKGLLSVVVVNRETGLPGEGFFSLARERGYEVGDSNEAFFEKHLSDVHNRYSP